MAKHENNLNCEWLKDFNAQPTTQGELVAEIIRLHESVKEKRRQELTAELNSLKGKIPCPDKSKPAVEYRSHKDPTMTWAGRGAEPTGWSMKCMKPECPEKRLEPLGRRIENDA